MVIISPEQERTLEAVARAKAAYDREVGAFEEKLQELRATRKEPIREAVRVAREAGVPDRQIHLKGLGMAQFAQMVNFLRTPAAKRALVRDFEDDLYGSHSEPVYVPEAQWQFRKTDAQGKMWEAISPEGIVYGINALSMGKLVVIKPNKDNPGQYADWTPELIEAAHQHDNRWVTRDEFALVGADDTEEDED